jgi:hypothetical protein
MKQIFLLSLLICSIIFYFNITKVRAQIESDVQNLEIKAQDLNVSNPKILPTNRFYFLKNFWRKINLLLTPNPAKKAELNLKYANEKLMEIKKMVEKKQVNPDIIEKELENYQQNLEKAKQQIENLEKTKAEIKEKLQEKYIEHSLKQQMVLQKLSTQVPANVYEKIEENRLKHLEKLGEVMNKVAEKQDIVVKVQETVQKITENKPAISIQTIEIFKNLEEKAPESIKSRIGEVKTKIVENAAEKIKALPLEVRKEIIENQLKSVANPFTALEIAEEIKKVEPTFKEVIDEVKTKPIETFVEEKIKNLPEGEKEKVLRKILIPIQTSTPPQVEEVPSQDQFKGLPEQTTKKIEVLKEVKQLLLEKLPESSKAPEVIQEVIDRQTNQLRAIEEIQKEKIKKGEKLNIR